MQPLSSKLADKLFSLFIYFGKKECVIEQNRQKLAHVPDFEPRQLFERLAPDRKHLKADDIFRFTKLFPNSQKMPLTIEMCHLMVKFWESKTDQGFLSLPDFTNCVLPHDNSLLRANVTQRPQRSVLKTSKASEVAFF